jgi:hypothetical protein
MAILPRMNSLFYKTEHDEYIGGLFMILNVFLKRKAILGIILAEKEVLSTLTGHDLSCWDYGKSFLG